MKLLYSFQMDTQVDENFALDVDVKSFSPKPVRLFLPGEDRNIKRALIRFYFCVMTCGKAKIYYVEDSNGAVLHTSYLVPKCFKFPFLKKGDYQIGPCFTASAARGRGLYPQTLRYICRENQQPNTVFYMSVSSGNTSSVRGIEKAGFTRCGTVYETKVLKRYYRK